MIDPKRFSHKTTFINLIFYKDLLADINSTNANKRFFKVESSSQSSEHFANCMVTGSNNTLT